MRAVIASDRSDISGKLRTILQDNDIESRPDRDIFTLQAIIDGKAKHLRADLILVVLPDDFEWGIHTVRAARATATGKVLAIGSTANSKALLSVLREGAHEYLDIHDLEAELASSFRRLQLDNRNQDSGRAVSVMGTCGGAGTSSLVANIAAVFAQRHKQSAIIDLRLGHGDQPLLLDLTPKHCLATISRNESRVDQSMFRHSLVGHRCGIQLLAAPNTWDECAHVNEKGVRQSIAMARSQFRNTVIDLDNSFTAEQVSAIISSDVVLLTVRPDIVCLKNARRMLETLENLGVSDQRVQIVATRCGQRGQLPIARVEQALAAKMIERIPEDARSMNTSTNKGLPVVLDRPRSRVAKRITSLAEALERLSGVYDGAGGVASRLERLRAAKANGRATGRLVGNNGKTRTETNTVKGNHTDELDKPSIEFSF